jgi:hypothetical protein
MAAHNQDVQEYNMRTMKQKQKKEKKKKKTMAGAYSPNDMP